MISALTPTQIGDISEAIVRARFIEKGYVVLVPQNTGLRYDIVVEKDGIFQRVQIKTGRLLDGETRLFQFFKQRYDDKFRSTLSWCYRTFCDLLPTKSKNLCHASKGCHDDFLHSANQPNQK